MKIQKIVLALVALGAAGLVAASANAFIWAGVAFKGGI